MDNLTKLLREADPMRQPIEDRGLSVDEAQQMRRRIVAAVPASVAISVWRRPLAIAAVVALLIGLGGIAGDRAPRSDPSGAAGSAVDRSPGGSRDDRRQLQFSTPGGTRIIWVFDQNLRLQESMP
jgi:hypothetical protein